MAVKTVRKTVTDLKLKLSHHELIDFKKKEKRGCMIGMKQVELNSNKKCV